MRLATIATGDGLRLHVRGRSGYIDLGEASGDHRLTSLGSLLAGGRPLWRRHAHSSVTAANTSPSLLGPAVPAPGRILCVGLNYREHALEGGREVPV